MILNGKYLKRIPYRDSRGTYGTSGQLYIAEDIKGTRFLVKTKSVDAANEYVAHRIAKLIGVQTSDAVLIKENLLLDGSYISAIEVLRRPDTDFLIDAFLAPLNKFEDTNLDPILADLDAVFPSVVSDFYGNCFEAIRRAINS